jgi:hypothetical protein
VEQNTQPEPYDPVWKYNSDMVKTVQINLCKQTPGIINFIYLKASYIQN